MAKTRRAYTGGAVSTTTSSDIAASGTTSFTITANTGWPYGSDPFYVVVSPGTASEEKILVTRAGSGDSTLSIASDARRGLDGTAAVGHATGAVVFPVFTAVDADEANELASKWSAKGDLVSYGSSTFEKLGVGSNGQFLRADSGETSGLKWETFNNTLGSGSAVRTVGTFVGGDVLQAAEMNALPGGIMAETSRATTLTLTGSFQNVLSVSFTAAANRYYKVTFICMNAMAAVTGNRAQIKFIDDTAVEHGKFYHASVPTGTVLACVNLATFTAGSRTLTLQAYRDTGASGDLYADAASPMRLYVEDAGPF